MGWGRKGRVKRIMGKGVCGEDRTSYSRKGRGSGEAIIFRHVEFSQLLTGRCVWIQDLAVNVFDNGFIRLRRI